MLDSQQSGRLLRELATATRTGRLKWSETIDEDMFRADFRTGAIRISKGVEHDPDGGRYDYIGIVILNKDGRIADEYYPVDSLDKSNCEDLFDLARRSARGSDDVIDGIFNELKSGTGSS